MNRLLLNLLAVTALLYGSYRLWPRTIDLSSPAQNWMVNGQHRDWSEEARYLTFRYRVEARCGHGTFVFSDGNRRRF